MKTMSYGQSKLSLIDQIAASMRIKKVLGVIDAMPGIKAHQFDVLELGCGYFGKNLQVLANRYGNASFEGIDLIVTKEPKIPNLTLIPGDISTWQPEKQFDIVLSIAVIEHLLNPLQHLQLIYDLIKPGGFSILTTPTPASHFLWHKLELLHLIDSSVGNSHVLYLTKSGFFLLAKKAGLRILEQRSFELGFNQIVVFAREEDE